MWYHVQLLAFANELYVNRGNLPEGSGQAQGSEWSIIAGIFFSSVVIFLVFKFFFWVLDKLPYHNDGRPQSGRRPNINEL